MAGLASIARAKGEIAGAFGLKQRSRTGRSNLAKSSCQGVNLALGYAADEVGLHIFRLRIGGVVHIAADVEVVVVGLDDLGLVHQAAVFGDLALVGEDEIDLLDVFGAQLVLVLAFGVFAVGVDEQHLVAQGVGLVLVGHEHAGGNAGAVKEAGRQADDGLDHIILDEDLADELFLAAPKEHAVGHDGGHVAVGLEAGQHVLDEHEVGLLAGLGAPLAKAIGELQGGPAVVLGKGRIGQDAVELADLAVFQNQRVFQGVPVFNGKAGDVVQDHVHVADRPDRAVGVLAVEGQIVGVLPLLLDVLVGLDEKAAGTGGGVVDLVARFGLGELHQQADDLGGGVELAAFLARAVGKELDQVFIGRAEQIGKLEVVVDQDELGLVEVVEQVLPLLVGDLGLAFDGIEVDVVFQHPGQGIVFVFDGGNALLSILPMSCLRCLSGGTSSPFSSVHDSCQRARGGTKKVSP